MQLMNTFVTVRCVRTPCMHATDPLTNTDNFKFPILTNYDFETTLSSADMLSSFTAITFIRISVLLDVHFTDP
jgi:hypothetical protein